MESLSAVSVVFAGFLALSHLHEHPIRPALILPIGYTQDKDVFAWIRGREAGGRCAWVVQGNEGSVLLGPGIADRIALIRIITGRAIQAYFVSRETLSA